VLSNPDTLIAISLAIAFNDSASSLFTRGSLVNSIKGLILNGLSNSHQLPNFNYNCMQKIIQLYFDNLNKYNGDYYEALVSVKVPILNCYSSQLQIKEFLFIFLQMTVKNDEMLSNISKYFEYILRSLKTKPKSKLEKTKTSLKSDQFLTSAYLRSKTVDLVNLII
jgi:hypothetical protein